MEGNGVTQGLKNTKKCSKSANRGFTLKIFCKKRFSKRKYLEKNTRKTQYALTIAKNDGKEPSLKMLEAPKGLPGLPPFNPPIKQNISNDYLCSKIINLLNFFLILVTVSFTDSSLLLL